MPNSHTRQLDRVAAILTDRRWHSMPELIRRSRGYRLSAHIHTLRGRGWVISLLYKRKGETVCTYYRAKERP